MSVHGKPCKGCVSAHIHLYNPEPLASLLNWPWCNPAMCKCEWVYTRVKCLQWVAKTMHQHNSNDHTAVVLINETGDLIPDREAHEHSTAHGPVCQTGLSNLRRHLGLPGTTIMLERRSNYSKIGSGLE